MCLILASLVDKLIIIIKIHNRFRKSPPEGRMGGDWGVRAVTSRFREYIGRFVANVKLP